ncbi:hypothetical protein N7U49_08175 [Streptomyces sp. AD2-2]|nr:hypothetical protein N7U49_08175 [Streptomyces sp. AD2-2]
MAGTIGQEVPTAVSLYLRTTIARVRLAELPGAGHFVFATRPDLVELTGISCGRNSLVSVPEGVSAW